MSTSFIALYRGPTIASAQLIAVSADPQLVALVADRLLESPQLEAPDPITQALNRGRTTALRLITKEALDAPA